MTKTTFAQPKDRAAATDTWFVADAKEQVLGRLAVRIAEVLMGKHVPLYTPHMLVGHGVIVVNAEHIELTGEKAEQKSYQSYSGYPGGHKRVAYSWLLERDPARIIKLAVRRMLPKSRLGRTMLSRLKVYRGPNHPHIAQQPKAMP
jgi:large subunit ribosomal protein L13